MIVLVLARARELRAKLLRCVRVSRRGKIFLLSRVVADSMWLGLSRLSAL